MGRLTLLAAGLLLAAAVRAQAPGERAIEVPKWFAESFLDLRDEVRDAARDGKRVMLYFGQEGCPYCSALMKADFGAPDIAEKTRRHFVAIALDLWGDREATWIDGRTMPEKDLARMLRVQFTPTLLFLDEKGGVALRLNGYLPPASFRIALDYATLPDAKGEAFTDYLARRTAAKAAAPDVSAPYFHRGPADFPAILAAGKPVIALYEYDGCRDCRELRAEGFARPQVRALLERFTVVALDLAGERRVVTPEGRATDERGWARSLEVSYAPTLVFLDGEGREVFRSEGYVRPFHLAGALDYVASGAYRREPSFQRYLRERSEALRAAGRPVDLWR